MGGGSVWGYTSVMPVLGKGGVGGRGAHHRFEAGLVYRESSRPARSTKILSHKQKQNNKKSGGRTKIEVSNPVHCRTDKR